MALVALKKQVHICAELVPSLCYSFGERDVHDRYATARWDCWPVEPSDMDAIRDEPAFKQLISS